MAAFIFDASGIVKRYLTEIGSGWVQGLTDPAAAHEILLTRITRVEIVAAITRRSRGGPVPATVAPALLAQFRHDAAHQGVTRCRRVIRCRCIFSGKNDELTPDFP